LRAGHQGDCHGGSGHRLQYAIRVHRHRHYSSKKEFGCITQNEFSQKMVAKGSTLFGAISLLA
jgi:hypothetical protein